MSLRTKTVKAGGWRTLETFWNVTTTGFFQLPPGAQIKLRYSGGWFGVDRQKQTLDGINIKRLVVSPWSLFTARMQVHVSKDAALTYFVTHGDVANLPPEIDW